MLRLTSVVALAVCGCGGSLAQPLCAGRRRWGWRQSRPPDSADSAAPRDASTGCGESEVRPTGSSDCCATGNVMGGSFFRDYDGVDDTDKSHSASVSSFAFDRYEVTVSRFQAVRCGDHLGLEAAVGFWQAHTPQRWEGAVVSERTGF